MPYCLNPRHEWLKTITSNIIEGWKLTTFAMAAPKKIDYERMEADWRAGLLSPRQIAAKYTEETGQAVSHAAVIKYFTKENIQRDLGAKIKAKAEAMVTEAMVTGTVTRNQTKPDREIIEEGAVQIATVSLAQRKDIARTRGLFQKLLAELEQTTENRELFEALGELMQAQAESAAADKLNQIYRKVIGLQGRITSGKELTLMLEKVVGMERQAYGMDKEQPKTTDGLTTLLQTITSGTASTFKPVARDPEHDEDD